VYPGPTGVTNVYLNAEINGSAVQVAMVDNGTNGDAVANDGRYTAILQLPAQLTSIGNISFSSRETNGNIVTHKVHSSFSGVSVVNLLISYYQTILGRDPEAGGAEGWASEIERIVSVGIDVKEGFIAVAKFFFGSDEYLALNKTNQQYVTDLYETFLQRAPAQAEIDYWVGYINQGMSRDIVMNYFAYSAEFKLYMEGVLGPSSARPENNLVNDFYRGLLNRLPDTGAYNSYLSMMRTAQCTGSQQVRDLSAQIALGFAQSAEYTLRNRSNGQFVGDLYNAILRRGALPSEVNSWVALLNGGASRTAVLQSFTGSPEFQLRVTEVINAGCY
jgi:hypothetical protein